MSSLSPQQRGWFRAGLAASASMALVAGTMVGLGSPSFASSSEDSSPPATTAPAQKNVLRIATSGFIDSFNPFTSVYLTPTNTIRYMYEGLVQSDAKDGSPTAGLAEKWETSPDGKKWTFTLHDGLRWSDDEPITSEDVKWTYQQMMDSPAMGTANGNLVSNFKSVESPDEKTLVINLKKPQAPNPGLEIPVVPEHIWSKIKNPTEYPNDKDVVGSGPYLLESYRANQSVKLKANPTFWRGAPKIDGIQYIYYTNSDAQVQALRAGEIDFVSGLTPTQLTALESEPNVTTQSGEGRRFTSISINSGAETPEGVSYGTGSAALKDPAVRQALRLGIDREALLKQVLDGHGTLATSFVPASWSQWHLPDDDPAIVKSDRDDAKKKLDDAGWEVAGDGIREKDGKKLQIRLLTDAEDPTEQSMAQYIKPWMKEIGIDLKVESTDGGTISDRVDSGADYDLYFSGWSVPPDPDYQLSINTCASRPDEKGQGATSQDLYCNPEFDKLYAGQHSELDPEKRADTILEAQRLNYTDVGQITLWYPNSLEAFRSDRFTGFTRQPESNGIIANQSGYWGYLTVEAVEDATSEGTGPSVVLWGSLGALVVVVGGLVLVVVRRRSAGDRE